MQHILPSPPPTRRVDLTVIDLDGFCMLGSVLGPDRMTRMSATFFVDAERRMALLEREDAVPADLQEHAHAIVSMAGHLGLRQLSALCMDLQERARQNGGLEARPALRSAITEAQFAVQAAIERGVLHDAVPVAATQADSLAGASTGSGRERMIGGGYVAAG